jgi:hypothetical protein
LDPSQAGVHSALSTLSERPRHVIGRFSFAALTEGIADDDRVEKIRRITDAVERMGPSSEGSVFNGVLIADWDSTITPGICNEIIAFLNSLNLHVFLEVAGPRFLDKVTSAIQCTALAGTVFMNGSLLPDGERRDYFDLIPMRRALETMTGQSILRDFPIFFCEILENDKTPTTATLKRTWKWNKYYGAIAWIGSRDALTDASKNIPVGEPDGGFDWLKRDDVVEVQEAWRFNTKVDPEIPAIPPICASANERMNRSSKTVPSTIPYTKTSRRLFRVSRWR